MVQIESPSNQPRAEGAQTGPSHRFRCRSWMAWLLVALVAISSVYWGLKIRRAVWDATAPVRFVNSVSNAIEWGQYANKVGVYELYDQLVAEWGPDGDYKGPARFTLDYPPLRLLMAAWWADWAVQHYPPRVEGGTIAWQPEYAFTEPMLRVNMACELAAAVGMFLLVYHWLRRCRTPAPKKWWTLSLSEGWGRDELKTSHLPSTVGLLPATLAAVLLWFNPAVIFNAHAYPQWDAWLLPAFIFAVYFGLRNWWLPAGIVVGICAMAKGQILFVFPMLIAWPLLMGNLAGTLRLLIGFACGVALIVWPWMLKTPESQQWIFCVAIAGLLLLPANLLPRSNRRWNVARGVLAAAAALTICWPAFGHQGDPLLKVALFAALAVLVSFIPGRRWATTTLATLFAGGVFLTVPLFNASTHWIDVGTIYATRHWKHLFWCQAANLGSILQMSFKWGYNDTLDLSWLPFGAGLEATSIRHVMIALYVILLALCVLAFIRHRRAHDPKLLLVMAVPFMLSYTILPQMIERYLIWPAALLSAYAAISAGTFLISLCLSAIACILMFIYMLALAPRTPLAREWQPLVAPVHPDVAWAVLALAGVMLCMALTRSRRPAPPLEPSEPVGG